MIASRKILGLVFITFALSSFAQTTTWTGNGNGLFWDDGSNWNNGSPSSSSGAVFNTTTGETGYSVDFAIASLAFNSGVGVGDKITGLGGAALTVNGAITNNTANLQVLNTIVNAGTNATWTGPIQYSNIVNVGTRQITLAGTQTFTGSNLNFDITNLSTFGHFLGSGTATVTGVTINIGGAYTGSSGDTFDFTTGNFSGATLGSLPTLSGGLSWNTSSFISSGVLSVVSAIPEPSTYAAIFGAAAIGFGVWRKRRKA